MMQAEFRALTGLESESLADGRLRADVEAVYQPRGTRLAGSEPVSRQGGWLSSTRA